MASLIDRRPPAWLAGLFRAPAVRRNPRAALTVGTTRHLVVATPVAPAQAADLFAGYARRHRLAARFIGRAMGVDLIHGDPAAIADRIPLMALRAQGEGRASATSG